MKAIDLKEFDYIPLQYYHRLLYRSRGIHFHKPESISDPTSPDDLLASKSVFMKETTEFVYPMLTIDSMIAKEIVSFVTKFESVYTNKPLVIDLHGYNNTESKCMNDLFYFCCTKKSIQIVLINLSVELEKRLSTEHRDSTADIFESIDGSYFTTASLRTVVALHRDNGNVSEYYSKELDKGFLQFVNSNLLNSGCKYLKSSNVFANKYFDVKKAFSDNTYLPVIVIKLCEKIHRIDSDPRTSFDYFICCSHNGSALASIIGMFINKPLRSVLSLGPYISLSDSTSLELIEANKRYFYIFDFVCLGAEFRFTRAVLEYRQAHLVGGAGVGLFTPPFRDGDGNIESSIPVEYLFNTNEDGIDYHVFFTREDADKYESRIPNA